MLAAVYFINQVRFEVDSCLNDVRCHGNKMGVSTDVTVYSSSKGGSEFIHFHFDQGLVPTQRAKTAISSLA